MNFSNESISFVEAESKGKYLGYHYMRKMGFGPELWKIEVFEVFDKLYGGDRTEGRLEPMIQENRKEILKSLTKNQRKK